MIIGEQTVDLDRTCPMCGEQQIVEVQLDKLLRWENGELIQNVWPDKTPAERELIKLGTCFECQKKIFGGI